MGAGDWIMATGEVRRLYDIKSTPVLIVGANRRPQWHEVFIGNPKIIAQPTRAPYQTLRNGPSLRPYIAGVSGQRWTWRNYGPPIGELFLTQEEVEFARPYAGRVMVEPNVKPNSHMNKAWPFDRWQALARRSTRPMLQCGPHGSRWLDGVEQVVTATFRQACAVLAVSRAFVGTEGGLHHAAAALGVPAVILWSEFIAPRITGYSIHRNIRHAGEPCGTRQKCRGCELSMRSITVIEVESNLSEVVL